MGLPSFAVFASWNIDHGGIKMNTKQLKTMFVRTMYIMVISAVVLSVSTTVYAAPPSPFLGHWEAIDVDGSEMTLNIAGRPEGPFQLTWTDDYISLCNGEAGIVRGTGWLNENDPNLLEADVHLECFTTEDSLDFHVTFRHHPGTNTLSIIWSFEQGQVTIWYRPGKPQVAPPTLNLRVNYGHDWVESFYEGGHMASAMVTDSDGNVKATAELVTEPKDFWGGETGFQTRPEDWVPAPPDIQSNDWVYAWVDNGASAQVQIGEISGMIDLTADSIEGTINATWFSDEVEVECHSWGAPLPEEILKYDMVLPDGEDTYSCSWAGEWDIQPGQDVGVGYFGPDGHWVANAFFIPMPTFVAYMPVTIVGYDWPIGDTINIYINDDEYTAQATVGNADWDPTVVLFELWRDEFTMEAGDHIVMTDEAAGITKDVWVTNLAVTDFDLSAKTVSGIYDPAYSLWVWLYGEDGQEPATANGTWVATFTELPPGAWGGATQWDIDGDGTSIDFQVPRVVMAGNFYIEWSQTNPEEVLYLSWKGSGNLTNPWEHPNCQGDLVFFGNSWVTETDIFWASLVGWGTAGDWSQSDSTINIQSMSSGCPGSAGFPINTQYQFFEAKPDLIMIQRTFEFGDTPYAHDVRPFIPRLYPSDGFTWVIHPNSDGNGLMTDTTCDFGCVAESWDGSWFAIHNPTTGLGVIVQRAPSSNSVALWLDDDDGSFTNATSFLLLQPEGGFTGLVTETEYLCFYDSSWTPSLTLPQGCQP
jgi:hypothetical protein